MMCSAASCQTQSSVFTAIVNHTGRVPKKLLPHMSREKKIEKLKDKLSIAVGKQEFEEAAKLRDEIKKLEDESAGEAG